MGQHGGSCSPQNTIRVVPPGIVRLTRAPSGRADLVGAAYCRRRWPLWPGAYNDPAGMDECGRIERIRSRETEHPGDFFLLFIILSA
jgi:hypothetical protein